MHYKNGREAHNGDMVVMQPSYGPLIVGILYDAVPGVEACNGNLAPVSRIDITADLSECLHIDDAKAVLAAIGEKADV